MNPSTLISDRRYGATGRHAATDIAVATLRLHLQRAARAARTWLRTLHSRHELRGLSDYELRDLGLSRCDVARETDTPFWRI